MSVDLTIEGAVAKIVLNRPDKLNALTVDMRQSLCDYFAQLRFDEKVRAIIVTGAGRGFCSGADVDRLAGQPHDLRAERAEAPTFALGLAKKLFHAAVGPSLEDYLEIESMVQPQLHMSADNAEGVAAFREKRKPKFIGR